MIDFEELRALTDQTRSFIRLSHDKARALRIVITEHDVVLGIFPSEEGIGLHVIKGEELLRQIASSNSVGDYTHTAIAVQSGTGGCPSAGVGRLVAAILRLGPSAYCHANSA
jgi:hypothetical protein